MRILLGLLPSRNSCCSARGRVLRGVRTPHAFFLPLSSSQALCNFPSASASSCMPLHSPQARGRGNASLFIVADATTAFSIFSSFSSAAAAAGTKARPLAARTGAAAAPATLESHTVVRTAAAGAAAAASETRDRHIDSSKASGRLPTNVKAALTAAAAMKESTATALDRQRAAAASENGTAATPVPTVAAAESPLPAGAAGSEGAAAGRASEAQSREANNMASPTDRHFTFELLPERPDFAAEEEKILKIWKEKRVLQEALRRTQHLPRFTFYDGPPFATGLPHYGHILAGAVKDVVTRYAQQTGHYVERRFGWDCHGLPVEYEIDKTENISHRQQIIDMGIDVYNEKCRAIVLRYASQWREIVERMGRWIDFDGGYRTMDMSFMESVWWVFKQLYDKGLVYRGYTIMPYSTACSTPLSNFEANLNYKDVNDPSIVVAFRGEDEVEGEKVNFLAWTTTPWTLPSNLALCVNPDFTYVLVRNNRNQQNWILSKDRLEWLAKQLKMDVQKDFSLLAEMSGASLQGKRYHPLYNFFYDKYKATAFRVLCDSYVTDDSGTGVVHCAPAFGEDDFRICTSSGVVEKEGGLPCPVDESGCFTAEVGASLAGLYVKAADAVVKQELKQQQQLIVNTDCVHAYPHCWRSDAPLIYKAVQCWFIRVKQLQQQLLKACDATYWVPQFVKDKRFKNWLAEARDWCVSRNRFWGTPIPLWISEDCTQIHCIGSKAELEEYAGREIDDLHRHFIDDITIPDPRGEGYPPLKRIPEVFDCWFESGSMPYGQLHYPFENQQKFKEGFPADFIGEGLDQTRGWFYTLLVISTALFDTPPFKNLIVNGLVLAADGKKMSKRLKNYAAPLDVVQQYSADALRIYLINSPVVRAETLRFRVEGVKDVIKDVILPWFHACRFFVQEAVRYESSGNIFSPADAAELHAEGNQMDRWILSSTQSLIKFIHEELQAYRLYTVVPRLLHFLEQLTNWYVRLNRDRMRGAMGDTEACVALQTLFDVLFTTVVCMAPLAPFTSELLYQTLKKALPHGHPQLQESVHFLFLPQAAAAAIDPTIERRVVRMQAVINLGRAIREREHIPLKTPLRCIRVVHAEEEYISDIQALDAYIKEELNVMEVESSSDTSCISLSAIPNFKALGSRVGRDMKLLQAAVQQLSHADLCAFEESGSITLCGGKHVLQREDLLLQREYKHKGRFPHLKVHGDSSVLVLLDCTPDESLQRKALAREIANKIQKLRKQKNLKQTDDVQMYASSADEELSSILESEKTYISKCLRRELLLLLHAKPPFSSSSSSSSSTSHDLSLVKSRQKEETANGCLCFTECLDVAGKPLTVVLEVNQN